jgi:hypothetical protein
MSFKLFKSTEDKMREAMFPGVDPEGELVKATIETHITGARDDLSMVQYRESAYTTPPMSELILLKVGLDSLGVGVVLYYEAYIFFISQSKILPIKDQYLSALTTPDNVHLWGWLTLVRLAWLNHIPLACVNRYREGFDVTIFIKDQKPKKVFLETKEP